MQSQPCILRASQGFSRYRDRQGFISKFGVKGEMRVGVNQAGQDCRTRQLNPHCIRRDLRIGSGPAADNLSILNDEYLIG